VRVRTLLLFLICATVAFAATPVWIDTDPSVARGGHEVDDGFALVQAFHSTALDIRGVSAVFGNAPLSEGFGIAQHLVKDFGPAAFPVFSGAASASELGIETAASRAMAAALGKEKLTILMLGPATNVATVLKNHPELGKQIVRIIAVAGRRPNQRFSTAPSVKPFRDFNFELDAEGFQVLLGAGVPLVLAPWEISSKVWIRDADLKLLRASNMSLGWIIDAAEDWLAFWKKNLAADGFNPFDTLAVGYAISSEGFGCERLPVTIEMHPDDTVAPQDATQKRYLIADKSAVSKNTALYCSEPPPLFAKSLLRLMEKQNRSVQMQHSGRRTSKPE